RYDDRAQRSTHSFPTRRSSDLEFRSRINDSLERICAKIGIPRSTTYTARHTVSTKYLRKGVDIMTIKEILGHSSITTTQRYLESIDYEGRKELNRDVL